MTFHSSARVCSLPLQPEPRSIYRLTDPTVSPASPNSKYLPDYLQSLHPRHIKNKFLPRNSIFHQCQLPNSLLATTTLQNAFTNTHTHRTPRASPPLSSPHKHISRTRRFFLLDEQLEHQSKVAIHIHQQNRRERL